MFTCRRQHVLTRLFKRYLRLANLVCPKTEVDISSEAFSENVYKKFKLILDVRSPQEYAIDHVPGAINIPILDDTERSDVGKIYNKSYPLAARLLGSSLIMKNLSKYLERGGILFKSLHETITNEGDQIVVYCWRGGQRSRSVAIVLSEIGITKRPVHVLQGGYKAFRSQVRNDLTTLPNGVTFIGICGLTGTGKTKILQCLQKHGETVLDLENLADHRGSVFGSHLHYDIAVAQPSQKAFESRLWTQLMSARSSGGSRWCRDNKPLVWVECESRTIGKLFLPQSLWDRIQNSRRVIMEATVEERIKHILSEYSLLTEERNLSTTKSTINWLSKHHPLTLVQQWDSLANDGKFDRLVESLLREHYDPMYSTNRKKFISCIDTSLVTRVFLESLDTEYIRQNACPKLIDIAKSWLI